LLASDFKLRKIAVLVSNGLFHQQRLAVAASMVSRMHPLLKSLLRKCGELICRYKSLLCVPINFEQNRWLESEFSHFPAPYKRKPLTSVINKYFYINA